MSTAGHQSGGLTPGICSLRRLSGISPHTWSRGGTRIRIGIGCIGSRAVM